MAVGEPFGWWPEGRKGKRWGWVIAAATVALNIGLGVLDRQLQEGGGGIVDFELARTFDRSFEIIEGWGSQGLIGKAKWSLLVDFPFLFLYAISLGIAITGLGRRLTARGFPGQARWAPTLAWAAVAAALFDGIENACLWLQLTGGARRLYALPAFTFASAKFVLLAVVVLYLVFGGLLSFRRGDPKTT